MRDTGNSPFFARPRPTLCLLALLAWGVLCGTASAQQDLTSLVRQSGFIFAGQIEQVGAATTGLRPESNTAIVRVVRVIDKQPPVDEIKGHSVTVRLRNPGDAKPGREAVFFTYLYGGGRSLGLDEVAELPDTDSIDQSVHAARQSLADTALRARLDSASAVAVARVLRTARVEAPSPRGEHEPMWWTATLEVLEPLKGGVKKGSTVSVFFPSNYDAYWYAAPKPKAGEIAIFLMQPSSAVPNIREEPGERTLRETPAGLFLLDKLDELDAREIERVRKLLNR